ncbi:hypothetical protein FIBSPDRAFT_889810 [Athelia psychrophila]|uniref:Uncharacterized protein n=1 Tax=Athelia psychrophila TaxID=1759441 RepID=A0A166LP40_9AGAM|nr:hypothetical protein FIBSPDRAFT_889810 [Fibularhizoctonia sp. CBS 109695]
MERDKGNIYTVYSHRSSASTALKAKQIMHPPPQACVISQLRRARMGESPCPGNYGVHSGAQIRRSLRQAMAGRLFLRHTPIHLLSPGVEKCDLAVNVKSTEVGKEPVYGWGPEGTTLGEAHSGRGEGCRMASRCATGTDPCLASACPRATARRSGSRRLPAIPGSVSYTSNGRIIAAHGQELHVAPTGQSGLQPVTSELRTPLELIANELSIDVVSDAAAVLQQKVQGGNFENLFNSTGTSCSDALDPAIENLALLGYNSPSEHGLARGAQYRRRRAWRGRSHLNVVDMLKLPIRDSNHDFLSSCSQPGSFISVLEILELQYIFLLSISKCQLVKKENNGTGVQGEIDLTYRAAQGSLEAEEWCELALDSLMANLIHLDAAVDSDAQDPNSMPATKSQVAHSAGPPRQETQGPQRPSSAHAAPSLTAPLPVPHLPGIAHFGLKVQVGPLVLKQSLGQTIWPPVSRNRPL